MKKLYKYMLNNPFLFALTCFFSLIYSCTIPLLSLIMEWVTNGLLADKKFGKIQIAVCFLFIISIFIVKWLNVYIKSIYLNKCIQSIKNDFFEKLFYKPIKQFRENETSAYITFLNNDIYVLENDFFGNVFEIISGLFSVIFSIVLLGFINIQITIALALIIFMCITLPNLFGKKLGKLKNIYLYNTEKLIGLVKDYLNGFEVIKIYDAVNDITQKFRQRNALLEKSRMKASLYSAKVEVLMDTSSYVLGIGMFAVCAYMVSTSKINYGQMVAAVQLSNSIMSPLMMVFVCVGKLIGSFEIWKKTQKLFENDIISSDDKMDISLKQVLRLQNVCFKYNDDNEYQLKNINIDFQKNKKYAIVGSSGSGKTTIIKLIMKYYSNYSGNIIFDDVNYNNIDDLQLYKRISYIQQEVVLFNDTLIYNITLGKEYSEKELKNAIALSGLTDLINNLEKGLKTIVGENGNRFSGGEKQRIALCRAILKSSDLIILDEMTTSLDYATATEIEKAILGLNNVTLIAVTHQTTEELMKLYDEIIVVQNGEIAEIGTASQLIFKDSHLKKFIK